MAFTTRRGRPRAPVDATDYGTDQLRAKRSAGVTTEPIDLCLARQLISPAQHWCGMHWRWLYTLRYGAPSLISRYEQEARGAPPDGESDAWRIQREHEYHEARIVLQTHQRYDAVMRVSIFNELPPFLSPQLQARAWDIPELANRLQASQARLCEGLELLVQHWKRESRHGDATNPSHSAAN